jgi:hypothetical protein
MGKFWHWITYHRHRSELWGLRLAMRYPLLAMHSVGIIMILWWFLASMPLIILALILGHFIGLLASFALFGIPILILLSFVAPWFFGWYWIACGLMLGRTKNAATKEKFLTGSIAAYRADRGFPNPG